MEVKYTLDKIKFGVDSGTWEKAVGIYEAGKIQNFQDTEFTYVADVLGTDSYRVIVSKDKYDSGNCTCYLSKNNTLCKHMITVAIYGLKNGRPLSEEEKTQHNEIVFSGKTEIITQEQLSFFKSEIFGATRFIKAYVGPSKNWFTYQDSLTEGCNRLSAIFSELPANPDTANLIINTLIRFDKKLQVGGVDDSDGTVGGFIEKGVNLLLNFVKADPVCVESFKKLENIETCFGWEEPLVNLLHSK